MSKVRKKKVKVKWKNFIILLIILFILVFTIIKIAATIHNHINPKETKEEKETISPKTDKEQKLEALDFINEQIEFFNEEYLDRYIAYKEENRYLPNIQIIKDVNMNLDQEPYEYTIKAKNTYTDVVLVNKYYYLEEDYIPNDLETINRQYALSNMRMVKSAKEAFESLSKAAKNENLNIIAMSTYRSYTYQVNLYNRYVKKDGKTKADTYSGRPGHSEHQTGLAVDVYNKKEDYTNFQNTKEYEWMQKYAHEYGFILRFPEGKEKETGYEFEAWHYRYVGKEIATYIHENDITLEEYYATKIKDW